MELGTRIKEIRIRLTISQKELSEQSGLTIRTIQRIENNEVKPSLHSLKVIGEVLKTDLSEFVNTSETKPYEFNLTFKINNMNQFINDLKTLFKNNWKIILLIVLILYFNSNYDEIKLGITEGWNQK